MTHEHEVEIVSPVARSVVPNAKPPLESILARISIEDRAALERLLTEAVEYIDHPSFARARTAKDLFGVTAEQAAQPWVNSADARPVAKGCGTNATLTNNQEQKLFLRMNYARYRMAKLFQAHAGKRLTGKAASELLFWQRQVIATRCEIVQANVPLVLAMAKRTRMGNVDYAELISEGNMALLRSVDKFDCGRGFKFSTYACRAILKSFSRVALKSNRYRGRFPTEFDPSLEKSRHAELLREQVEIDCVDELRGILRQNLADLNDVEVRVIQARFALGQAAQAGGDVEPAPKTLEQVGDMIGVTKERVRQIQNRALAKLRSKLQDDFLAA